MARTLDQLTPDLTRWIGQQKVFFVATAPAGDGHVNMSPKGYDTFRVVGPTRVAYLDLTGSGVETIAHLRHDGRITMMFCAFEGPPRILRLYGRGEVHEVGSPGFESLRPRFCERPGMRSIVTVDIGRISSSCGFSVPFMDYSGERSTLDDWAERKGDEGLVQYRAERNQSSIDGLAGLAGLAGLGGLAGNSGSDGLAGLDGNSGNAGLDGNSGNAGLDGNSGNAGLDDSAGLDGGAGAS